MVREETWTRSASCCCVIPAAVRSSFTRFFMSLSPLSLHPKNMKLASREVHFILYTGPPVCQAPPERIFFLVQKVGGEDTRPLRRSGCGKSPVPGGLFSTALDPVAFPPRPGGKVPLLARRLPLLCKGGGGYDLTRGGLPAPRAPLPDPEPSFSEKEGPTSWAAERTCVLSAAIYLFSIFSSAAADLLAEWPLSHQKGSGLSTRLRESRPPGTG